MSNDVVASIKQAINVYTEQVIECRKSIFALVAALTNQPALDALLTVLQSRTESSPQLSIGERLIRSGVIEPTDKED